MGVIAKAAILLYVVMFCKQQRANIPRIYYVDDVGSGLNAKTIPPFGIFINKSQAGNMNLLEHELVHWQQYQEHGLLPFYGRYLCESALYGYDEMPMELEARFNEDENVKYNYTEAVRNGTAKTVYNPVFRL